MRGSGALYTHVGRIEPTCIQSRRKSAWEEMSVRLRLRWRSYSSLAFRLDDQQALYFEGIHEREQILWSQPSSVGCQNFLPSYVYIYIYIYM